MWPFPRVHTITYETTLELRIPPKGIQSCQPFVNASYHFCQPRTSNPIPKISRRPCPHDTAEGIESHSNVYNIGPSAVIPNLVNTPVRPWSENIHSARTP